MAKNPINSLIGTIVPIIIVIVIIIVAIKFQTDIGNFISKISRTEEERAFDDAKRVEEKRKDENGLFDNIAEFFFGKPTEDEPATDDGVSNNDFDQNSATQQQRASKAQAVSDANAQAVSDANAQATFDASALSDLINQGGTRPPGDSGSSETLGFTDSITVVLNKDANSKSPARNNDKTITLNLGSGSGTRITATPKGLLSTGGQSGARADRSSSSKPSSPSSSSLKFSDSISVTLNKGANSKTPTKPKGNLSKQSQSLNTKTRGSTRFNR